MARRHDQRGVRPDVLWRSLAAARARSARHALDRADDAVFRRAGDGGKLCRASRIVRLALSASVQGTDWNLVPFLPRLEACAASAAFRQSGSQPRASGAGYRLSRLHAFQPFDPQILWLEAARHFFRFARSCDLSRRAVGGRARASMICKRRPRFSRGRRVKQRRATLLRQRAAAFLGREEGLVAGNYGELLVVVPWLLGFGGFLDLEQIEVMHHAAVLQHLALRESIVDRQFLQLL